MIVAGLHASPLQFVIILLTNPSGRGIRSQRLQCDEIWSFIGEKEKNTSEETAFADPASASGIRLCSTRRYE